jgi:hypothetical protein
MRASRPNLEALLVEAGGQELATRVAAEIADYMGATKKFRDFLLTFLPTAAKHRPVEKYQIPWEPKYLKRAFEQVYAFRSKALHGSVAFPLPLCCPPNDIEERLFVESVSDFEGHKWLGKDLLILLHTFEYAVRGALVNWWRSLDGSKPSAA